MRMSFVSVFEPTEMIRTVLLNINVYITTVIAAMYMLSVGALGKYISRLWLG